MIWTQFPESGTHQLYELLTSRRDGLASEALLGRESGRGPWERVGRVRITQNTAGVRDVSA